MKELLTSFLDMWKADYDFKTITSATLSAMIGVAFTLFNGILGIRYQSVWNGSICVYYILLAIVRGTIVGTQRKTKGKPAEEANQARRKIYVYTHLVLILISVALIAPIAFMIEGRHQYTYGMIPAIAMAAYTTYRLVMGSIHFKKSRKEENILVKEIRVINLQDSLISLLTLQNALIIACGTDMHSMMKLTVWSSTGIWCLVVFFTVKSFWDIKRNGNDC